MCQEVSSIFEFNNDIKEAIVIKEAISTTNASAKYGSIGGGMEIEQFHEHASTNNVAWSRNWRKNSDLAAEAEIVLYLIETVACEMRRHYEGKIKMRTDCRKVW